MSTTAITRSVIVLPLPAITAPVWERAAFLYSALNAGWVRVQFRKADGTVTSRVCTRNRSIMHAMGVSRAIMDGICRTEEVDRILYWDYMANATRGFRVSSVQCCGIDAYSPDPVH